MRSHNRLLRWLLPERNPEGTVYGILVVGSLLAAEAKPGAKFESVLEAVVLAIVMYWLAHAYASELGERIESTDRRSWRRFLTTVSHEWAIVRGAMLPLVVLVVAGLAGAGLGLSVNLTLGTCAAMLVMLEVLAGVGEGLTIAEIAFEALIGVVLGLGLFALKILLH